MWEVVEDHITTQSESLAFILSVLDSAAISSASFNSSAFDKMPLRCRACIARMADNRSAFARLQHKKEGEERSKPMSVIRVCLYPADVIGH